MIKFLPVVDDWLGSAVGWVGRAGNTARGKHVFESLEGQGDDHHGDLVAGVGCPHLDQRDALPTPAPLRHPRLPLRPLCRRSTG